MAGVPKVYPLSGGQCKRVDSSVVITITCRFVVLVFFAAGRSTMMNMKLCDAERCIPLNHCAFQKRLVEVWETIKKGRMKVVY